MSQDNAPEPNETSSSTIEQRVEEGRRTGSHANGAIVPFPPGLRGGAVIRALTGSSKKKIEALLSAAFRPTYYEYRSANGDVIQVVIRFDHASEPKQIRPVRYCGRSATGHVLWTTAVDKPRPLYGLDRLARNPEKTVLVTEGEKAADEAARLFPDYVSITWMSGASNVPHAEMLALAGRDLILWPDNDLAGRAAMRLFAAHAHAAGASSVRIVDVPREFGEKWDLADDVPEEHREAFPIRRLLETARVLAPADVRKLLDKAVPGTGRKRLLGHKPGHSAVDKTAVAHALAELDPSMGGREWYAIGRSLYLAFGKDGFKIFDDWSRGSAEKYKTNEPAQMWDKFATEDGYFAAGSLASLMRKARDLPRDVGKNYEVDAEAYVAAAIEELNEDHAVVTRGSKTVVMWERYDPRFRRFTLTFLRKSDFTEKIVWKVPLPAEEGDKPSRRRSMPLGKLWFESGARRQYEAIYFAPGQKLGPRELNTWNGFAVDPVDNPGGWSRLKQHLFDNVARGDQVAYDYILNWLAFGVQRLDQRTGTALVLQGAKGAGKSILIVLYGHLFGSHTWVTAISEDIVGRFNAHLEDTLLLGVEEAFAPQNRAADGTLKDLITTHTLRLEDKFFSAWSAPNHLRIIMTSNNDQVVRADGFDRRYAVFEVLSPFGDDPDGRRRYFGEMVEQMETGGYEAMLGELLSRDISSWNPEAIPVTEALKRQKLFNLSNDPVTAWYHSRLEDGIDILSGEADTPAYYWSDDKTVWVPVSHVLADYSAFAKRHGHRGDDQRLKNKLARFMPAGFESKPRSKDEVDTRRKVRCYPFPPLDEARRLFTAVTGFSLGE